MIPILWALTSSVAYGLSDFVGGAASRRAPALQIVLCSFPVSALLIAAAAAFGGGTPTTASLIWGAASGALMGLAMWSFYVALAAGPMSVVSPLTAVIVTVVPVVIGIALGERPSPLALGGIALAAVAVVFVSAQPSSPGEEPRRRISPRVLTMTITAGLAFAFSFVFTDQITVGTGLWPLVSARVTAAVLIFVVAAASRRAGVPRGFPLVGAIGVGALDAIANSALLFALQSGSLSISSAIIALYPVVTVALAILLLRERVSTWQAAGLALAVSAVLIISLNS